MEDSKSRGQRAPSRYEFCWSLENWRSVRCGVSMCVCTLFGQADRARANPKFAERPESALCRVNLDPPVLLYSTRYLPKQ